jgi:hypothetical protein
MFSLIESTRRSNHNIFLPQNYGSPFNDTAEHISGLGLARLDFERCAVAGEVVYIVEGDSIPTSQQDEEARIATLAHALKKLGNREDAAEFMRCLNAICEEGDARYRQVAASYYYSEIAERGVGPVLKEMALIAMHLASLNPVMEEVESDSEIVYALRGESKPRSLFDREVAAINRMIRGRRKGAGFVQDEWTERLNDLEANGATADELDDAFAHVEALDQYDDGGAIVRMSAHERTFACGRVDHEFTADDLPEQARFLAGDLLRDYASGVEIKEIWDEVNAKLDVLFPVKGRTAEDGRFFSRANLELQRLTRDALEGIFEACFGDYHSTAMRNNRSYRRFYARIRRATDTRVIGELMKQAYEARQDGNLSVKHFIALNTAGNVSLAYLYRNNELKNLIERLQAEQVLNRSDSGQVIIDAVNDKRLEVVRLLDENASLRATNKRLQDQNKRLKAENEIIRELEVQVMKLTRENDRMMKRIALLSAGLSK